MVTMTPHKEDKSLFLDISHITNYKEDNYSYTRGDTHIRVSHEPNDLFVRYEITNAGKFNKICYSIGNETKNFHDFYKDLNGGEIDHILVYYIRYNATPLYLSIFVKNQGGVSEKEIKDRRINYRMDKSGVWKPADHLAYVFNDLNELAYEHDMFQYFEIDKSDKDCPKSGRPIKCPILSITASEYGEYKVYKHKSSATNGITSLFLYRNKIIKNLIVVNKYVNEIDVYYDSKDNENRLPLLIVVHKKGEKEQYFFNEGGNYRWEENTKIEGEGDKYGSLSFTLKFLKDHLTGKKAEIDIGYEFEELEVSQTHFGDMTVLIQNHDEMGYKSIKYSDDARRFSIGRIHCDGDDVVIPGMPIFSLLEFYVFQHGSSSTPLFLCAVHELRYDKIFVWYQLKDLNEYTYEISYLLSGDPRYFTNYKPIINMIETRIYTLDIELIKTVSRSYNYGVETMTNIGGINFYVTFQKRHPSHNKYIMAPAFSNYFSIKNLKAFDTVIEKVDFQSAKEIHVFEHYNLHHYKVCIVTAEHNYFDDVDTLDFHWFEIRRNTNKSTNWKVLGRIEMDKTPEDFDDPPSIATLLDERIYFYKDGKDVYYEKPTNGYEEPNIKIEYNKKPYVEYKPDGTWPPIEPIIISEYGPGNLYTTIEFDEKNKTIRGTTLGMPGKIGGITPLVGGLIGSGASVGIVGVTTGYVLYSNIGTITTALGSLIH